MLLVFRNYASGRDESLYEIESVTMVNENGVAVPCYVITAFFQIQKPRHVRAGGGNLRVPGMGGGATKRNNRDDDDDMDLGGDGDSGGGGGGGGRAKKPAAKKASGGLGGIGRAAATVGLFMATLFVMVPQFFQD